MPKDDIDYSNTIVYKIYCIDKTITDVYIGHTTNFTKRKYQHKTSCGNSEALKYKPNLTNFAKKNDFRIKAKPLMDAVIMSVGYRNPDYINFKRVVVKSRNLSSLKKELL